MTYLFQLLYSNALVGEHIVGQDPDCKNGVCLPSVQDIEVASVKLHEDWDPITFSLGNDIALARLKKPAILFFVSFNQFSYLISF